MLIIIVTLIFNPIRRKPLNKKLMESQILGTEKIMISNVLDKAAKTPYKESCRLFFKRCKYEFADTSVDIYVNMGGKGIYNVAKINNAALSEAGGDTIKQDAAITTLYIGDDVVKAVEAYNSNDVD